MRKWLEGKTVYAPSYWDKRGVDGGRHRYGDSHVQS